MTDDSRVLMTLLLPIAAMTVDGDLVEGALRLARLVLEHALPMRGGEPHVLLFLLPIAEELRPLRVERVAEPHRFERAGAFVRGQRGLVGAADAERLRGQR